MNPHTWPPRILAQETGYAAGYAARSLGEQGDSAAGPGARPPGVDPPTVPSSLDGAPPPPRQTASRSRSVSRRTCSSIVGVAPW